MKAERTWNLIGLILGAAIVITGIIFAVSPAESYSTKTPGTAEFGGDFYTYEYEATRMAASNAATTANNIRELGHAHALYAGLFFVFAGLLVTLHFGKRVFCVSSGPLPAAEPLAVSPPEDAELAE